MKPEAAQNKFCPFTSGSSCRWMCMAEKCMAWHKCDAEQGICSLVPSAREEMIYLQLKKEGRI